MGMTFFSIINPDVEFPLEMELNLSSEKAPDLASKFEKLLKEMIANKSKPQSSKKYKQRQLKEWGQLAVTNCITNAQLSTLFFAQALKIS